MIDQQASTHNTNIHIRFRFPSYKYSVFFLHRVSENNLNHFYISLNKFTFFFRHYDGVINFYQNFKNYTRPISDNKLLASGKYSDSSLAYLFVYRNSTNNMSINIISGSHLEYYSPSGSNYETQKKLELKYKPLIKILSKISSEFTYLRKLGFTSKSVTSQTVNKSKIAHLATVYKLTHLRPYYITNIQALEPYADLNSRCYYISNFIICSNLLILSAPNYHQYSPSKLKEIFFSLIINWYALKLLPTLNYLNYNG